MVSQTRSLKVPLGFENLNYWERLRRPNLTSLKNRRIRGDLIVMFKVERVRERSRKNRLGQTTVFN